MLFEKLRPSKQVADTKKILVPALIIKESHQRCRDKKIKPNLAQMPQVLNKTEVEVLLGDSKFLLSAAWPIIKYNLYPNFSDEDQLIILCNHEGYALALMSSPKTLDLCDGMDISLGTCFREEICGTNAIALAMYLKKVAIVRGQQHYCQLFKDWSCIAAPVRSPRGVIAGYLGISMSSETEVGHTQALVQAAAVCIEQKMYIEKLLGETIPKTIALPETLSRFETLSAREKQIFSSMAKGQTAGEIAGALRISRDTVGTYRKRIYKKLGIKKKIDCSNKARELGLLSE